MWPQEAVAHQGFSSAGVVLPFIRGLAGLEGDALNKTVNFTPHFPADWTNVFIDNYRVGKAVFSFDYTREKNKIKVKVRAENAEGYRVRFGPVIGTGSQAQSFTVDGDSYPFNATEVGQVVQVSSEIPLHKTSYFLELAFIPTLEILPVDPLSRVGEMSKSVKIISVQREGARLEVKIEGLSGEKYGLGILNTELVESVDGARIEEEKLKFQIPGIRTGLFVPHTIRIHLRK